MKTIIVDDERLARSELKNLLKAHEEVEVIAECSNAEEAIGQVNEKQPDLVFLDIQMPGKNGFEMLEELDYTPRVIFITAYDEYAIKAFEVNALDYLLKPVEPQRLAEALGKVKEEKAEEDKQERSDRDKGQLQQDDQIFLKDGDKCWFVTLRDVRLFESEGNYVRVFFKNNKPLILKSLNRLEERLDDKSFFRANRKFIINLRWVEEIEPWFNGGLQVKLMDGSKVEVSRRQAAKFKDVMSL